MSTEQPAPAHSHHDHPAVVLMGPRASGKSSVGGVLAERLGRRFVDLDHETVKAFADSPTISSAWRTHGEAAWRTAEARALERVVKGPAQVIALGGGTPMIPDSQRLLRSLRQSDGAFIVYLQVNVQELQRRLRAAAGDRPALKGQDAVNEVESVLREREPTYLALANLVVDASRCVEEVAGEIAAKMIAA